MTEKSLKIAVSFGRVFEKNWCRRGGIVEKRHDC